MELYQYVTIQYPASWKVEYRSSGKVALWRAEFPDTIEDWMGSCNPGTLDLFAQYALMFLLRKEQGANSITWYNIADVSKKSVVRDRTVEYWGIMRKWMGETNFGLLQSSLVEVGLTNGKGEPDLFCWHPESGKWFFAEAKGKDKLLEHQLEWFRICRNVLGELADVRVYRLVPVA